ncbi:hypothetical protein [Nitrosomonas sp. Nm34]|uniref:hypothetical protein n=1 Tax=Nitrosomonas sp. Nm34 TaxID=1881055 RepID=UPI0008E77C57|nr:hypothetical protein [Nitrosomonas sp. Nm34]SFJ00259.1 hypothetical protein SAMN05428978_107813 [Nitrosomonas sp. Nm34]
MFKVEEQKSIKWPVNINIPKDGGGVKKATFTAEFELIDQDEFSAIYQDGGNDLDMLRRVLVGWGEDVVDEKGSPLPYGDETREKLIKKGYVRAGLVEAYMNCNNGKAAARKN